MEKQKGYKGILEKELKKANDKYESLKFKEKLGIYRKIKKEDNNKTPWQKNSKNIKLAENLMKKLNPPSLKKQYHTKIYTKISAIAYDLMNSCYPSDILEGARLYEKIGRGEKIAIRLLRKIEKAVSEDPENKEYLEEAIKFAKKYQEKSELNSEEKKTGLESKLTPLFGVGFIIGIALSLSSLNLNGWVVSNLTHSIQGGVGVLLIIGCLIGLVLTSKK